MNALDAAVPRRASGRENPWLTLVAVALGVMMVALDGTVVSVANQTIGEDLNSSLAGLQWVTNGYLLALAVLLIVGGKLGDRFGRMPAQLAESITNASHAAFMSGLHTAMWVSAGLALVSAAIALLVGRGHGEGGAAVAI